MKRKLVISIIINIVCIPLSLIYIFRKIQFYKQQDEYKAAQRPFPFMLNRQKSFEIYPVTDGNIIFLGDSHTNYFELNELLKYCNILNRGIIEDTTKGVLNRLNEIIKRKPSKVFIEVGINDILHLKSSVQTVANNEIKILERLRKGCPQASLYWQTILPVGDILDPKQENSIAQTNALLKAYCSANNITYIDLYSAFSQNNLLNEKFDSGDHLHLNGRGYLLWRDLIKKYI